MLHKDMPILRLASTNPHKLAEFKRLLGLDFDLIPAHSSATSSPCKEDGVTFLENAIKKALHHSDGSSDLVLADDSGLRVTGLGGEPGVYSARYAGPKASDAENRRLLLERLAGHDEEARDAAFFCALALARNGKIVATVEASCPGRIAYTPKGTAGFGYDPIFHPSGAVHSFAEMLPEEKDRYSHRARAIARLLAIVPPGEWA